MLAIEKSRSHKGKCTPNILPCRINHNGPVDTSSRYWNPSPAIDGKTVAYFRGRKLHGKQLKLPDGYRGVVVSKTEKTLPKNEPAEGAIEDEDDDEKELEVKIMEEQSEFDSIMIWGHEAIPDETADPYVKGVEEWVAFAEQIHSYDSEEKTASK